MEAACKQFRKRNAILSCLRASHEHPSAETLHTRLRQEYPDISLGTVYRNLSLFKERGIIVSLGAVQGVERFDGNTEPHVHFVCTACGAVKDLPHINPPESLGIAAAADAGGRVDACRLTFTGLCGECLARPKEYE